MSKGMYTAVSGAIAQSAKLDTIANNLANVNTSGFKRDAQLFKEYLTAYEIQPSAIEVPRIPASIESFYDVQGGDKSYVDLDGTFTDFQQGAMKSTGNPLDVAIEGDGFFEVLAPDGVKLTRAGSFSIDSEGKLVNKQGLPVLRDGGAGQDPATRFIKLGLGRPEISSAGEISQAGQSLGKLSIVQVGNRDALAKVGASMFGFRDGLDPALRAGGETKMSQGFLEGSNVNIVREMTDMIAANRTFESMQKAIQAYDSMQGKVVNDVPKLGQG